MSRALSPVPRTRPSTPVCPGAANRSVRSLPAPCAEAERAPRILPNRQHHSCPPGHPPHHRRCKPRPHRLFAPPPHRQPADRARAPVDRRHPAPVHASGPTRQPPRTRLLARESARPVLAPLCRQPAVSAPALGSTAPRPRTRPLRQQSPDQARVHSGRWPAASGARVGRESATCEQTAGINSRLAPHPAPWGDSRPPRPSSPWPVARCLPHACGPRVSCPHPLARHRSDHPTRAPGPAVRSPSMRTPKSPAQPPPANPHPPDQLPRTSP